MRRKKSPDRKQLAFDLDGIIKDFEDSFIKKLETFFNKIANTFLAKSETLEIFLKNFNTWSITKKSNEVLALKKLLKDFYKKIGKQSIKALNKEIKDITGKKAKIVIPNINEGMRERAELLSLKKANDFKNLIIAKLENQNIKEKKDLISSVKKATKVFKNRHIVIVSRMESITAVNNARLEAAENSKILIGWQFLAILDKRTTQICQKRHGKIIKKDNDLLYSQYKPPCHWGCRSLLSPVSSYEENISFTSEKDLKNVPPKDFGKNTNKDFL